MARTLLYLASNKNVPVLFSKIQAARKPDALTHSFLRETLGLKGTADRQLITMLKALGFIDQGGRPTADYDKLKNPSLAKTAIAAATRKAYEGLFAADENAHVLPSEQLRGLIAQVAGTDADMTGRIAQTFSALVKAGDFNSAVETDARGPNHTSGDDEQHDTETAAPKPPTPKGFRSEFHYNIQIHLPSNGTEETYMNIFSALQRVFR